MYSREKFKVIVLDFDGVIIESNHIKHNGFEKIFRPYANQFDQIWEYHLSHPATPRSEKFDFILANLLPELSPSIKSEWLQEFHELTYDAILQSSFVPGALEFLEKYSKMVPMYLASATPQETLNSILKFRELKRYFRKIFGAPSNKARILEQIVSGCSIPSRELLFIGDAMTDLLASQQAKTSFLGRDSGDPFPKATIVKKDFIEIDQYLES